jgi:Flp pilus assembly protein TadD
LEVAYSASKDAFQSHYHIELGRTSAEQVMAVIRKRPKIIQGKLIAALDHSLAHLDKGDTQAREWLIAVLEIADTDPWRSQARQALSAQDWRTVEKLVQEPVARNQPRTLVSWLATSLPRNTPMQLQVLRQIQQAHQDDFWANFNLACTYQYRMDPPKLDEAIRYHTAALAVRPRNPGACVDLGNALRDKGDLNGAIEAYRHAIAQQPNYASAHSALGLVLERKGDIEEAIGNLLSAAKFAPQVGHAHLDLVRVLYRWDKRDEVIAAAKRSSISTWKTPTS